MLSVKRRRSETSIQRHLRVLVNGPEYRAYEKEQRALVREIADQTGQLPSRIAVHTGPVKNPITDYDTIAMDADGNLLGVQVQP
jgi:hypothetical protein